MNSETSNLDTSLEDHFSIVEVSDGHYFAEEIFRRKLGGKVPDYGRHVIAFYKHDWTHITPLGYQHVLPHQGLGLCGGGSVDGRAFTQIPLSHSQLLRNSGGVLSHLLRFVFVHMAKEYEAFMTYCGQAEVRQILSKVGFQQTSHQHLMAHFHRPCTASRQQELIKLAHDVGPF